MFVVNGCPKHGQPEGWWYQLWDKHSSWLYTHYNMCIFKGCRPCRRPRKNRQGSQANWHKNSSVLRTLRLSTFFLCILLWNIFDRFEFSFVNGFFMIYWLSWSRRSLCMSIQVRAMWSGGVAVWVAVFDLGWTYNKWHYHKGIFTLWSWTKLHCVARGCLARNCWFVLMVFSFHFLFRMVCLTTLAWVVGFARKKAHS